MSNGSAAKADKLASAKADEMQKPKIILMSDSKFAVFLNLMQSEKLQPLRANCEVNFSRMMPGITVS